MPLAKVCIRVSCCLQQLRNRCHVLGQFADDTRLDKSLAGVAACARKGHPQACGTESGEIGCSRRRASRRRRVVVREANAFTSKTLQIRSREGTAFRFGLVWIDQPLYLICQSGKRSSRAAEKFLAAGYDNIINVIGGTQAWQATGLPIEQNEQVISLERQVRITAGTVTLLGILLAYLIHPFFLVVAIFVGAGLVFAGIDQPRSSSV